MPYSLPDPSEAFPVVLPDGSRHSGTVHLRAVIDHPRISVGAYTYASDFDPPADWAARLVPYLYPFSQDHLRIGKFCQIAQGVRFITSSANHETRGFSSFPFAIYDEAARVGYQPDTRDTVIGHDVWLGTGAMVAPGAQIGNGVIVGAGAVVRGTIPDYAVVAGNPAQVVRMRFDAATIARLQALAWWDWPPEAIARAHSALVAADLDALEALAP